MRRTINLRRGLAPVELLISLPMFGMIFLLLLIVGAAGLATSAAWFAARQTAWRDKDQPASTAVIDATMPGELETILHADAAAKARRPISGRIDGDVEARLQLESTQLVEYLPSIVRYTTLLGGTWDERTIAFETKDRHPRLRLEPRLANFDRRLQNDARKLEAFKDLVPH